MSFIKNIGKNISSKGKELSQKAKVMSETSSLNNIIKGEECKIDFQYKSIGKMYYEKYCENPGEEFAEAIEIIKSSMEKIEQTKEEIIKIKAQFNCPSCGTPFKNGALFCSKCGAKLPEKQEEPAPAKIPDDAQKCANCGNILNKNAVFCNVCGNKLEQSAATEPEPEVNLSETAAPEESTAEILTADRNPKEEKQSDPILSNNSTETSVNTDSSLTNDEKSTKICPNCQNEMLDEDIFCNECGTKVE